MANISHSNLKIPISFTNDFKYLEQISKESITGTHSFCDLVLKGSFEDVVWASFKPGVLNCGFTDNSHKISVGKLEEHTVSNTTYDNYNRLFYRLPSQY